MDRKQRIVAAEKKAEKINDWLDSAASDDFGAEAHERFDAGVARATEYIDMASKGAQHIHESVAAWRNTFGEVLNLIRQTEDKMRGMPFKETNAGHLVMLTMMIVRMNGLVAQATRQGLLKQDDAYKWANAVDLREGRPLIASEASKFTGSAEASTTKEND